MTHVLHSAEGWRVGEKAYSTLREAIDAARSLVSTNGKSPFLRDPDTGEVNGAWRWLPATEEESAPIGGVRIDAVAIDEMAESLNSRSTPIPIDGGPAPDGMLSSDVHGTASTHGGTPANGWAHWAVSVAGSDGVVELYLWAELIPSVAREVDAGRIAMGSVHFGCERIEGEDSPRGCVLISHALTNNPAVTTLAPANSVRSTASAWRSRTIAGRVLRGGGEKVAESIQRADEPQSEGDNQPAEAQRGPGQDALAAVLQSIGAEVPGGASPDDLMAIAAKLLEEQAGQPDPTKEGDASAARARDVASAAASVLRNRVLELEAELKTYKPLLEEKRVRDRELAIDGAMAKRGMKSAEQRKAFIALAEKHGNQAAIDAIEAAHVPPGGVIAGPETARGDRAPESTEYSRSLTDIELERAKALVPELRKQFPNEPEHFVVARAQKAAKAR